MHVPFPAGLLETWERGLSQPTPEKALSLLGVAFPEKSRDFFAGQSIGQRNLLLLSIREQLFGPKFVALAVCPKCQGQVELNFTTEEIQGESVTEPATPLILTISDYEIIFRLPNSEDLSIALTGKTIMEVEQILLERCLISAQYQGQDVSLKALPSETVDMIAARMEYADPYANIQLSLTCPVCAHAWSPLLDLATYTWDELDGWARRTLYTVHVLASAYGWSENDILNMQPWKRHVYMEMISV